MKITMNMKMKVTVKMRRKMKSGRKRTRKRKNKTKVVITDEGERRRNNVLKVENARLEIRRNFYNIRAANVWNKIPDEVREKKTVNGFKAAYDGWKRGNPTGV